VLPVALAAASPSRAQGERVYDARTWGEAADTLRAPAPGTRIALRSAFLEPGSVRVSVNGAYLPPEIYQVNPLLGTLRLLGDVPAGATVVVTYRRRPLLMAPVYTLRPADVSRPGAAEPVPTTAVVPRAREETGVAPNLAFGGTKSVSFATGSNRGSTLDQSLEATVEGQLTPTIKVRALLSDNNLPIQPQGNTEELEYFDKVFVEMEGPNARAAVGDLSVDNRTSSFSAVTRQLRGFSGGAWNARGRITAAAAETKGEFRTIEFRGTTGLQGPYALLSAARTTPEVIIAGTERVYVDGQRAERGPNRDYVIDYDVGAITFTPRRLITTDTEIAVDFEVTEERYDRSTVLAAAEKVAVGGGVNLSVLFAREADDRDRPKTLVLSSTDRDALAAAGDDPAGAVTGGVTPADSGQGTYVLVPADSVAGTPAHYRFDEIAGDLLVSFVEVGTGLGDYRRAGVSPRGTTYFEFVGAGNGEYIVGKELPLPASLDLVTARLARDRGSFTFDGEWNVSDYDRNLFSSLDDGDNRGQAGQLRAGLFREGAWRLGVFGAAGVLEDRFQSFDRARPWYYYRDWNLEDVALVGRETTQEIGVSAARAAWGNARYTLGRLDRDAFTGVKHDAAIAAGRLSDRGAAARGLVSDTEATGNTRTRRSFTVDAAYGVWAVVPAVSFGTETYRNAFDASADSGRAYDLVLARLSNRGGDRFTWRVEAERRETDAVDPVTEAWVDSRRDDTVGGALNYRSRGAAQADVQVIHRREDDLLTGGERTTDLARLKAGSAWNTIGLRADADYEVSQNDAVVQQRSVVFVGEGKGDYNEFGEPVGKNKGAYTVIYLPTPESTPVHSVGFNLRTVWKPSPLKSARGGAGGWILRNVSIDMTVGVREQSTYEPAWKVYLLLPSALQRDDATAFGSSTLRQDWSFLEGYRNVSLTFRYLREDREDNRFEGVHENVYFGERVLRFSRSLSARLTATAEAGNRVERRGGEGIAAGTGSSYDVNEWTGLGGLGIVLYPGATLDVDLKGTTSKDDESGAEQRSLQLQPRLVWRLAEQINVFATYELSRVTDLDDVLVRPIVFARPGTSHRWSATANLRVSKIISIYATYSGRNETVFSGQRVTEHDFRLETRAYF
jgi:hypothetical protein